MLGRESQEAYPTMTETRLHNIKVLMSILMPTLTPSSDPILVPTPEVITSGCNTVNLQSSSQILEFRDKLYHIICVHSVNQMQCFGNGISQKCTVHFLILHIHLENSPIKCFFPLQICIHLKHLYCDMSLFYLDS